jgi:RNA methyltransferase, TrmH family
VITSSANPTIKQIRKLRDKKERLSSGLFYIEGLRIVIEAMQLAAPIETLVIAPDLMESSLGRMQIEEHRRKGVPILEVSKQVFTSMALKESPQGVAAVVRQQWTELDLVHLTGSEIWVALDSVADPGNLGTILRTLDAVGGNGVILLDYATDPYDPTTVRASMGAIFSLKLVKTSFEEFVTWKQKTGYALIGTSGSTSMDYCDFTYPMPMVLLMGSERQGLLAHHIKLCDQMVKIPMAGRSDSLNLAVATAVVLYEAFNQRREKTRTAANSLREREG